MLQAQPTGGPLLGAAQACQEVTGAMYQCRAFSFRSYTKQSQYHKTIKSTRCYNSTLRAAAHLLAGRCQVASWQNVLT